ncbi:MAG: hypothetical protein Q8929_00160 [Bacillota bacterium]|nr:hypothetical protein [Bacillota bacterium]
MKLFPKNRLFISLLTSSISSAFLLTPAYAMDPPLKEEELNKFSLRKPIPFSIRERLGDDIFSFEYYNTAHGLLQSSNPEERIMGAVALRKIVKKSDHPDNHRASTDLFNCAQFCLSCGTEEDKKIGGLFSEN